MQLKILAGAIPVRHVIGPLDRAVESIAYDSRRVQRNGLFVALRGEKNDEHEFIGQAIENGASVIVAEREEKNPRATCLLVENTRPALADLAATFYGLPARRLKLAAVTGTNGKTTTTFLIKHICEKAGLRCGLIGTVRYEIGERVWNGRARRFSRLKLPHGIWRHIVSARRAGQKLSRAPAVDRPVQRRQLDGGAGRSERARPQPARSSSQPRQIAASSWPARD